MFYHVRTTKGEGSNRLKIEVEIVQIRLACGHHCEKLSWWMTDVEGLSLLWVEPSLGKVGLVYTGASLSWTSEPDNKQHSSMIPTLSFCPNFPCGKSSIDCDLLLVNEIFPPSCCFWSEWLITATEKSGFCKRAENTKGRKGYYRKLWLISSEAWL